MHNGGQWHGFGQKESADMFRELVEITPQIPFDKLVYQARIMKKRITKYLAYLAERRKQLSTPVYTDGQDSIVPESNC